MKHIKEYILPDKYKGKQRGKSYKMINFARSWTKGEEDWLLMLKDKGVTNNDIAFYLDRNVTSIRRKVERLKQKVTLKYNDLHKDEKYEYNSLFLKHINPKSVLDLYAGPKSYYLNKCKSLITNDINKNYDNTYNIDALKILCKLYHDNKKFDCIDELYKYNEEMRIDKHIKNRYMGFDEHPSSICHQTISNSILKKWNLI